MFLRSSPLLTEQLLFVMNAFKCAFKLSQLVHLNGWRSIDGSSGS
ncbi:hypothetical protein ABIF65_007790 [Bradyrhizobium japonicum]|jgi:hypothetical protein|uniref:Uncharacterized protein n=2 Tax=Bradyrhizobium TaxID=374 RepID=A0ABV4FTE7_9BRAD|nr:hypothetical protein [Bradyrhizobium japonicum]MCS3899692.1 hypothetical protein [Bradyrhizobium japonicum USDA 38]MCS3933330.1 hypothetical protein [Bradyrhizobium elkanii]MBP1089648.1 hypothetical protein [Bradyrhizobium japonicum]MCP1775087.1 hypothetical protein [Bradyrhizobium japonicum]